MLSGNHKILHDRLITRISKSRVLSDPLHTLAFSPDASFYRLIPKFVVRAEDEQEIAFILKEAAVLNVPVTFRASGTSLSGQSVTDSVLILPDRNWKGCKILENGTRIRVQPGLQGVKINSVLAPFGRKIGPDPASLDAATIGGIIANNASGMRSGIVDNAYNTIVSIRVVLADGTILDTGDKESRELFLKSHPQFVEDIAALGRRVAGDVNLVKAIREKYSLKNTTGYSLNSFTDFSDPFDVITHLMIGSEGTLGFISEITLDTINDYPFKASSLMIFPDTEAACIAVTLLKTMEVSAAELIDRTGIRAIENEPGMPDFIKGLPEDSCTLLVETSAATKPALEAQIRNITEALRDIQTESRFHFTDKPEEYEVYWQIRKGLFPSAGAMRSSGTTVIIEDVAFPVPRLAGAIRDLREILRKCGYHDAVIYGHALEGNMHFIFSQDFRSAKEIKRYDNLMSEVAVLVLDKYRGSLKAEHGTGRNVAPFVEREWGKTAYTLMEDIKKIFDPLNILNPGVILNKDPEIHLKNLKSIPVADDLIDKCIECGFCEPSCVSAGLTLTPRQRIVVFREIFRLKESDEDPGTTESLIKSFGYSGNQTCATDGLCAISCPVRIDTGKLIRKLRADKIGSRQQKALWISQHMALITAFARAFLPVVSFLHSVLGTSAMKSIAGAMRKISGNRIPAWNHAMPSGARRIRMQRRDGSSLPRKVVYFPSCINRSMGVSKDHSEEIRLTEKMVALLRKGGYEVIYPENLNNLCCGMPFFSKGYNKAGMNKSAELEAALIKASDGGKYPVLCDMSPCLFTMRENMKSGIKLYEPVEFITLFLLPHLKITPLDETITVFPVCTMKKMGLEGMLVSLAKRCAREVIVPEANCCGFAGDRGFTFPELNAHGLRNLRLQIPEGVKHGFSNSRTCEIGFSLHSGISYKSIVYLVDKVSSAIGG